MHTKKLLGSRRGTYILDVICSRLYFWDVQEEVLTQSSGQGISAPRTELSIIGLLQQKNKHGDRGNVFVNIPVSGVCLGNSGKTEGHCKCEFIVVYNAP